MSSFYGGKQGRTYHIVQRYDSVENMVNAFKNGGSYSEVNYGQYVLIDTVLKSGRSNDENGLLYRRGFDYNDEGYTKPTDKTDETEYLQERAKWVKNPGGGAIYVGQIVGPEGRSPELEIEEWLTFQEQKNSGQAKFVNENQIEMTHTRTGKDKDSQGEWIGKTIKAGSINILDDYGDIVGARIAIDIPKLVIEAEVSDSNPYAEPGVTEDNESKDNQFYYKWGFTIPQGKRGTDFDGLQVETANNNKIGNQTKDAEGNDIKTNDKYITYSTKDYTDSADGTITQHQGVWPYRLIKQIITNNYTRNIYNENNLPEQAKLGDLYRPSNAEGLIYENLPVYMVCIKSGPMDSNIQPQFKPAGSSVDYILGYIDQIDSSKNKAFWQVITLSEEPPIQGFTIDMQAGESYNFKLRNLDHLMVNNQGDLYAKYTDSETPQFLTKNNLIDNISFGTNGSFIISYKNGSQDEIGYNSIAGMKRSGDNILFLFSNENVRNAIPSDKKYQDGETWVDPTTGTSYVNPVWYNFGPLGAQYHVQGMYTYASLKGDPTYPDYNNGYYLNLSNGFTGDLRDRMGWLVTVKDINGDIHTYAYDYNQQGKTPYVLAYDSEDENTKFNSWWYEIMSLQTSALSEIITVKTEEEPSTQNSVIQFIWYTGHDENY